MTEPSEAAAETTAAATTKVFRKTKRAATTTATTKNQLANSESNTPAKKKTKTSGATQKPKQRSTASSTATTATIHSHQNLPTRTLILDNGGDTIKYGWATNNESLQEQQQTTTTEAANNNNAASDSVIVQRMPNLTARLPQQLTVLVGDQVQQLQNPNSVLSMERSTERTIITHLGNQVQVWKRILDVLGVTVPTGTATAAAMGWTSSISSTATATAHKKNKSSNKSNNNKPRQDKSQATTSQKHASSIPAHTCAVLLALPPHYPHHVLEHILQVWWHDFGFARVGFCLSIVCAAAVATVDRPMTSLMTAAPFTNQNDQANSTTSSRSSQHNCVLMVDLGWSATHICPVYNHRPISDTCLRRIPLGGRHLINLWKYYSSYRQWNMMDQEWVMRDVWEQTAYVSLDFRHDWQIMARRRPAGRRPYDLEYVLPDYEQYRTGRVQIPLAVQKQNEAEQRARQPTNHHGGNPDDKDEEEEEDDEDDEDFSEQDAQDEDEDNDDDDNRIGNQDDNSDGDSSDDEEQLRRRLVRERQEEERRRREQEAEQQVLHVSVERFAIPEVLFRPSDAGLPLEWANLPQAVVQSIEACPLIYRAALYQSIQLTGGLSQLTHLAERLEREVRALAPAQYKLVRVTAPSKEDSAALSGCSGGDCCPVEAAWRGANRLVTTQPCGEWSVGREEGRSAWKRLLWIEGGNLM